MDVLNHLPVREDYDVGDFNYPYQSWIDGDGDWKVRPVIEDEKDVNFNDNIFDINAAEVYWFQVGENDEDAWMLLCKCGEYWIYFEANCDYIGFDCQGGGIIEYSTDFERMWNMGLDNTVRRMILESIGWEEGDDIKGE